MHLPFGKNRVIIARLLLTIFLLESCSNGNIQLQPKKSIRERPTTYTNITNIQPIHISSLGLDSTSGEVQVSSTRASIELDSSSRKQPKTKGLHRNNRIAVKEKVQKGIRRKVAQEKSIQAADLMQFSHQQLSLVGRQPKQAYYVVPTTKVRKINTHSTAGQTLLKNPNAFAKKKVAKQASNVNQDLVDLLANQTYIAQGGYQVTFEKEEERGLQAFVKSYYSAGVTREVLPVIMLPNLVYSVSAVKNKTWQQQFIHVAKGCVYIGSMGLLGGGKIRTGLKLESFFEQELLAQLPRSYKLGTAYDNGDCFFDALAQCVGINHTDVNTVEYLRKLCHEFYEKNKALVDKWDEGENEDYSRILYTADAKELKGGSPVWGRPWVEGKILCRELGLAGICIIEICIDADTGKLVSAFYLVDHTNYVRISDEENLQDFLLDRSINIDSIPILAISQVERHYVPVLASKNRFLGDIKKDKKGKEKVASDEDADESEMEEETDNDASEEETEGDEEDREDIDEAEADELAVPYIEEEEKDIHYFPRCEYYTRYAGTTHFAMEEHDYWGTYFRSTGTGGGSARYTRYELKSKTFKNSSLNIEKGDNYHARTGTFQNPYTDENYRKKVEKTTEFESEDLEENQGLIENIQRFNLNNPLYEQLLDYRNQICLQVRERTLELLPDTSEKFEIIHHNEYPCLLVKIPFIQKFKNIESWNKLFIAYYVAIINKEAEKAGIPIEMVIRSSFGHFLPSIDVTGNTFRINMGIVPECYGEVVAKSLAILYDIIINKLSNVDFERDSYGGEGEGFIGKINNKIRNYNKLKPADKALPEWGRAQKCYEILRLKGDPSGKSVACQITRKRAYIDLLADYVAEERDKEKPDLALPIATMLAYLKFGKEVSMGVNQTYFQRNIRKWPSQENTLINQDNQFWNIITQVVKKIGGRSEIYLNKKVLGLYNEIERTNKEFIIRSASTMNAEDGLGSDSEYDGKTLKGQCLYWHKITVTTGMMAINVAHYLARYYLKTYLGIDQYRAECKNMYYETEGALKLSAESEAKLSILNNRKKNNPTVLFFDLNHCDASGTGGNRLKYYVDGSLVGKHIPVVVMDCTSSTSRHIKCAINDAIIAGAKLVLLVSSGLKNEQLGADNNPYGTVRIIASDRKQRNELYKQAKAVLKDNGGIPATAHRIRKGYKSAGLILTNQLIANADVEDFNFNEEDGLGLAKLFTSLYEIRRYKQTLLEQIELLSRKPIQISQERRKLIGEARASELEQETVIGHIENILCSLIVDGLKPFMENRIKEEFKEEEKCYEREWEEYEPLRQQYEDGDYDGWDDWDWEGPVEPQPPRYVTHEEIAAEYGDLDDLSNLIEVSGIKDDTLSQILYDEFITIDGMDDVLEALKPEYNTLNLKPGLVRMILEGCDVQFYDVDPTEEGFLVRYLKESIEEQFEEIVKSHKTDRNKQGFTRLHIAVQKNNKAEVKQLLFESEIDINDQENRSGDTPLHLAAAIGNLEIVGLLVARGADICAKNKFGKTPLHEAISRDSLKVRASVDLLQGRSDSSYIDLLNKFDTQSVINFLLQKEANIQDETENSSFPLHTAAKHGNAKVARLLIAKGLDVNARDSIGGTPLHIAVSNGHVDVVELLLKQGADANVKDMLGDMPLHKVASSSLCTSERWLQYMQIINLLCAYGAKGYIHHENNYGFTALEIAQRMGKVEIAELLTILVRRALH